jgi:hypothetical protein
VVGGHRKNVLRKDTEKKGWKLKELLAIEKPQNNVGAGDIIIASFGRG